MEQSITFNASEESPPLPFPHRRAEYSRNYQRRRDDRDRLGEGNDVEGSSTATADDSKSCFVVATTFSFFVALTLSFGVYGTETLRLGPNSSILIKPNHLLVDSIKVDEVDGAQGPMIYGFHKDPPLDVEAAWSENHEIAIPGNFHKEWMYYLNEGSQINISYGARSPSTSLVLVIAQGDEDLAEWLLYPSYPKTTLSWNLIHGNGSIQKHVSRSSYYYVAVGNLNSEFAEVCLNITMKAFLYNTAEPYYKCMPSLGQCRLKMQLLGQSVAIITSPGGKSGIIGGGWQVKLTYGPRWLTYLFGIGGLTSVVLLVNYLFNYFRRTAQGTEEATSVPPERNPLLSHKDGNLSSEDSSYASPSDEEEGVEGTRDDGQATKGDDEYSKRTCAICFDSLKDSFFLPCGHSVACFVCAERILQDSGTCPVCRRRAKKVRRIYTA